MNHNRKRCSMDRQKTGVVIRGLITPSAASNIANVSRATLRRRSLKGELTVNYVGGNLFYTKSEVIILGEEYARTRNNQS